MNVSAVTDTTIWREIFDRAPRAHFFQSPEWSAALCSHFPKYGPGHLLFDFGGKDRFVLPLIRISHLGKIAYSDFSLPLGTFGGFLGEREPLPEQVAEMAGYLGGSRALKVVISCRPDQSIADISGFVRVPRKTFIMRLDMDYERIERERFTKKKRESVGRARRRGVIIRNSKDEKNVEAFLGVVDLAMREKRWGVRYSHGFIREILSFPQTDLWTAWYRNSCASGIVSFFHNREATAWLGAMDHRKREGQPMNLLKAEMMRHYGKEGGLLLDLGSSLGIESLEWYKRAFGCEEVDVPVFTKDKMIYTAYRKILGKS